MLKVILQKIITVGIAVTFMSGLGGSQTRAGKCSEQCNNLYLPLPLEPSARAQAVGNLRKCLGNCRKAKRGDGNSEGGSSHSSHSTGEPQSSVAHPDEQHLTPLPAPPTSAEAPQAKAG